MGQKGRHWQSVSIVASPVESEEWNGMEWRNFFKRRKVEGDDVGGQGKNKTDVAGGG